MEIQLKIKKIPQSNLPLFKKICVSITNGISGLEWSVQSPFLPMYALYVALNEVSVEANRTVVVFLETVIQPDRIVSTLFWPFLYRIHIWTKHIAHLN